MKSRSALALIALVVSVATHGAEAAPPPAASTTALTGTYVLVERPANIVAIDQIQFHPDGTCILDIDARIGVPGKYKVSQAFGLTSIVIDSGTANATFVYQMVQQRHGLNFNQPVTQLSLAYVLLPPDRQAVQFSDVEGIYLERDSNSDNACEITADHKFRVHYRGPWDPQAHSYIEGTKQGKCTFADEIITYFPEQPYAGNISDQYLRDVVVKHDAKGLWIVDPYDDVITCETPATSMDLPPPSAALKSPQ